MPTPHKGRHWTSDREYAVLSYSVSSCKSSVLIPLSLHKRFLSDLKQELSGQNRLSSHVCKPPSVAATDAQHRPGMLATDGQMWHCIYSVMLIMPKKHANVIDTPITR